MHNSYLFDKKGVFTADFESMYLGEERADFDAWEQDQMSLYKEIDLLLLEQLDVETAIDLGCGKGLFTNMIRKYIPKMMGVDVSPTAIDKARARYSDVEFRVCDLSKTNQVSVLANDLGEGEVDLMIARALLYYLPNWLDVLNDISHYSKYVLLGINVPDNTKLYIPSKNRFLKSVEERFNPIEVIDYVNRDAMTILAESKD